MARVRWLTSFDSAGSMATTSYAEPSRELSSWGVLTSKRFVIFSIPHSSIGNRSEPWMSLSWVPSLDTNVQPQGWVTTTS